MVDIQMAALGTLKKHPFTGTEGLLKQIGSVGNVRFEFIHEGQGGFENLLLIEGFLSEVPCKDKVLVIQGDMQPLPENVGVEKVPDPDPGPGQVVVKVHAIGVNPVETYIRAGTYHLKPDLPFTPGQEAAGERLLADPGLVLSVTERDHLCVVRERVERELDRGAMLALGEDFSAVDVVGAPAVGADLSLADEGLEQLRKVVDTAITIPNDRLRGLAPKNAKLMEMFLRADEILLHSVKGITDLIMMPGLVNLDFADVKTTMSKAGMAIMGIGIATGDNRSVEAAERAMSHPLLEDIPITGAKGVLMNITSNSDMEFEEVAEASERIHEEVGDDADIFWGTSIDDSLGDEMRVTVLATGIGAEEQQAEIVSDTVNLPLRGKVRDITPNDLERDIIDYEEPTFIRQQKAVGESNGALYRGHQGLAAEDSELDVPTFLRRKAD